LEHDALEIGIGTGTNMLNVPTLGSRLHREFGSGRPKDVFADRLRRGLTAIAFALPVLFGGCTATERGGAIAETPSPIASPASRSIPSVVPTIIATEVPTATGIPPTSTPKLTDAPTRTFIPPTATPKPTQTPTVTIVPPTATAEATRVAEKSLADLARTYGIRLAFQPTGSEQFDDTSFQRALASFDGFCLSGPSPESYERFHLSTERRYSELAQKKMGVLNSGPVFYQRFYASGDPLNSMSPDEVASMMQRRAESLFLPQNGGLPYVTHAIFANEPMANWDSTKQRVNWMPGPLYNALKQEWPKRAYAVLWELFTNRLHRTVGKDVHLIWNESEAMEMPGPKADALLAYVAQMRKEFPGNPPVDIGIQFHVRTVPQSQVKWGGPLADDLDHDSMVAHFKRAAAVGGGKVHITEFTINDNNGSGDPQKDLAIVLEIMSAAKDSGAVDIFNFWSLFQSSLLFDKTTLQPTSVYNGLYKYLLSGSSR
jgi:hypothetical protein